MLAAAEARHDAVMCAMAAQDASLAAMMAVVMRAHIPGEPPAPSGGSRGGGGDAPRRSTVGTALVGVAVGAVAIVALVPAGATATTVAHTGRGTTVVGAVAASRNE